MGIIASVVLIALAIYFGGALERTSFNRTPPEGTKKDWDKATNDILLHGKDYYHKQNLAGKYDMPADKKIK